MRRPSAICQEAKTRREKLLRSRASDVNAITEERLRRAIVPLVEQILSSVRQEAATRGGTDSER